MTATNRSYDQFATTRWSVVMQMASSPAAEARGALTELAHRYWYPVYAYVRRCGHEPEIAQGIARSFLLHLLHLFRAGRPAAAKGHFRQFLLTELNTFLAGDWREAIEEDATVDLPLPPPRTGPSLAMGGTEAIGPEPMVSLTASDGTGLTLVDVDARAVIDEPLALTEIHFTFENPEDRVLEGRFSRRHSAMRSTRSADLGWNSRHRSAVARATKASRSPPL